MVSGLCIVCRPSSNAPDSTFAPRCSRVGWSSRSGTAHGFSSARRDAGGGDHEQPMMRRSNASCGLPRPLHFGPCALPDSPEPRRAAKIWERRLDGVSVVGDDARWLRARASVRRHRTRAHRTPSEEWAMTRPNGITGAIGKASALNGRPERSVAPRVGGSERDGGDLRLGHPPGRRARAVDRSRRRGLMTSLRLQSRA